MINQGAIEDYTKILAIDQNDSLAYNSRGVIRQIFQDYKEAIRL